MGDGFMLWLVNGLLGKWVDGWMQSMDGCDRLMGCMGWNGMNGWDQLV